MHRYHAILALPLAALTATVAAAPAAAPQTMTCSSPIKPGESAASIKARYGKQARVMTVNGPEGMEFDALVIWPNDPSRRIEVMFGDEDPKMRQAVGVRLQSARSKWRVAGIGIGSNLAAVVAANGRAIKVSGFGWDYGGSVDPQGGKLGRLPGGCGLSLVMSESEGAPDNVYGDGLEMSSNEARLKKARPTVVQMLLYWRLN